MHEVVRVGQLLPISRPRNAFALETSAPNSLLLAGGIGITPILAMGQSLRTEGRDFSLHYCCRSRDRAAFLRLLTQSGLAEHVHLHFDDGATDQRLDLKATLAAAPASSHLYVCGPTGFMDFVIATARAVIPEDAIHREYFAAPDNIFSQDGNAPFEVRLARSGRSFQIPADQTVAAVLIDNGVDVPLSCEQGICGTCLVRVVAGIPGHRDTYLSEAEHAANKEMTLCCSRSRTPVLEIDL